MTDEEPRPAASQALESVKDSFKKMDSGEQVVLLGTVAVFFLGFLPWYTVSLFGQSQTISGFAEWHGKLFFLTSLATACLLISPTLRQQVFEKLSPNARSLAIPVLAAATFIFGPVFFMLNTSDAFAGEEAEGLVSAGKTMWFALAFLAAAAAAGVAVWKWKQSASATGTA